MTNTTHNIYTTSIWKVTWRPRTILERNGRRRCVSKMSSPGTQYHYYIVITTTTTWSALHGVLYNIYTYYYYHLLFCQTSTNLIIFQTPQVTTWVRDRERESEWAQRNSGKVFDWNWEIWDFENQWAWSNDTLLFSFKYHVEVTFWRKERNTQ